MGIEFLDAASDADAWREALQALPQSLRDVYFEPDYVALHCLEPGMEARMAVYRERGATWLYPFIRQPVPGADGLYDFESPYGYAGPLADTGNAGFLKKVHAAFRAGARDLNTVAEFIRFHPLLDNARWVDPEVQVLPDRETRSIEIPPQGDVLDGFGGKARNMVRRAVREGLEVVQPKMADCAQRFAELYRADMDRLEAHRYYYFSPDYVPGLAKLVDRSGFLLAAERDGQWYAAALFLYGCPGVLHYHLAATSTDLRMPGATNLLIAEAAKRAQARGCTLLHLGGGRTADAADSLFRFKRAMGSRAHPFQIGKRVLDPQRYRELKDAWSAEHPELTARYGSRVLCYRYRS